VSPTVPDSAPGPEGVVRVRAVVAGLVQGVWFRESCRRQADRLGVGGWVHNLADGRVEIEAEGEAAAVDALVEWAHEGPRLAVVESVTVERLPVPRDAAGRARGFAVR
jgi:acylphosphatase